MNNWSTFTINYNRHFLRNTSICGPTEWKQTNWMCWKWYATGKRKYWMVCSVLKAGQCFTRSCNHNFVPQTLDEDSGRLPLLHNWRHRAGWRPSWLRSLQSSSPCRWRQPCQESEGRGAGRAHRFRRKAPGEVSLSLHLNNLILRSPKMQKDKFLTTKSQKIENIWNWKRHKISLFCCSTCTE